MLLELWFAECKFQDDSGYFPIGVYYTREQAETACKLRNKFYENHYHIVMGDLTFNKLPKKLPVWLATNSVKSEFVIIPLTVGEEIHIDG